MKVKGIIVENFTDDTFSLDIVDDSDNTIIKGKKYPEDRIVCGFTVNTSISNLTCSIRFLEDKNCYSYERKYSTPDYIKI